MSDMAWLLILAGVVVIGAIIVLFILPFFQLEQGIGGFFGQLFKGLKL